eukprot:scaffold8679_cov121-Isochrysis_galbana.AAC.5
MPHATTASASSAAPSALLCFFRRCDAHTLSTCQREEPATCRSVAAPAEPHAPDWMSVPKSRSRYRSSFSTGSTSKSASGAAPGWGRGVEGAHIEFGGCGDGDAEAAACCAPVVAATMRSTVSASVTHASVCSSAARRSPSRFPGRVVARFSLAHGPACLPFPPCRTLAEVSRAASNGSAPTRLARRPRLREWHVGSEDAQRRLRAVTSAR